MKKIKVIALAACLALAVVLTAGPALAEDKVTITGSTTVLPIAQKAAEVYMKKHPEVSISVAGTGSGDGIKSIIDGLADIGNASRDMKDKEVKLAKSKGVNPVRHTVALDCIVPVVHPSNPVSGLTLSQLKDIYTGKIKNWKEVGGQDKVIVVISRDSSSGTFEVWNKIGYVGIGYLSDKIKGLTVDGVQAGPETAKDGSYKIARKLFMFTKGQPSGAVKDFLDFVKSAEGQGIVEAEGFVKVN